MTPEYQNGQVVIVKTSGQPWWPAVVESIERDTYYNKAKVSVRLFLSSKIVVLNDLGKVKEFSLVDEMAPNRLDYSLDQIEKWEKAVSLGKEYERSPETFVHPASNSKPGSRVSSYNSLLGLSEGGVSPSPADEKAALLTECDPPMDKSEWMNWITASRQLILSPKAGGTRDLLADDVAPPPVFKLSCPQVATTLKATVSSAPDLVLSPSVTLAGFKAKAEAIQSRWAQQEKRVKELEEETLMLRKDKASLEKEKAMLQSQLAEYESIVSSLMNQLRCE